MVYPTCSICFNTIRKKMYRLTPGTQLWNIVLLENTDKRFTPESRICQKCYKEYHRKTGITQNPDDETHVDGSIVAGGFSQTSISGLEIPGTSQNSLPGFNISESVTAPETPCHLPGLNSPVQFGSTSWTSSPQLINFQQSQNCSSPSQAIAVPSSASNSIAESMQARRVDHANVSNGHHNASFTQVKAVPASEAKCFICSDPAGRRRVSNAMRRQVWHIMQVYIPINNRVCGIHCTLDGLLTQEALSLVMRNTGVLSLSTTELMQYFTDILNDSITFNEVTENTTWRQSILTTFSNNDNCKTYTGLDVEAFEDLLLQIEIPGMYPATKRTSLAIFLGILRMGNSQSELASMYGILQPTVSKHVELIREALESQFVPKFLGYGRAHMPGGREQYISQHSTTMSNILYSAMPGSAIVLLDGTYLEIGKSSNYMLQKATFSLQKHYNLVKAMIVCAPDGYIVNVEAATLSDNAHNDASLFNHLLDVNDGFKSFFLPNDIILVDRGFRDSVDKCEGAGFEVRMPSLLAQGQKQFTWNEANQSRLVTKTRWVVEAVNGRIKKVFKFFAKHIDNTYIPKIGSFLRIACALLNAYSRPLNPDDPTSAELAHYIVERSRRANFFLETLQGLGLDIGRQNWIPSTITEIVGFPILSEEDLIDITIGIYQLKQSPSYTQLHVHKKLGNENPIDSYGIFLHSQWTGLLKVHMESRHVSAKHYVLFISYVPHKNGLLGIDGYYCSCQVGARTLGTCSHIASVLWVLGFAIYEHLIPAPAAHLGDALLNLQLS